MSGVWIAGADGCKGQWCVVLRNVETNEFRARLVPTFQHLVELPESPRIVAVDIPIGLPEFATAGGRACEREARRALGSRASCVFSAVGRSALKGLSRQEAHDLSRASGGSGVGAQAWGLSFKLREADQVMTPQHQRCVHEVHPEVSFWAMNKGVAMTAKKTTEGERQRRQALASVGFPEAYLQNVPVGVKAKADDFLDACAALWTAQRILLGTAKRFPISPDHDCRGLDQAIWY